MIFDNAYFIFGGPTLPSETNGSASESADAQNTSESADPPPFPREAGRDLTILHKHWRFVSLNFHVF